MFRYVAVGEVKRNIKMGGFSSEWLKEFSAKQIPSVKSRGMQPRALVWNYNRRLINLRKILNFLEDTVTELLNLLLAIRNHKIFFLIEKIVK